MTETKKTRLSETDGLQVVVLPEGFHLDGDDVLISQDKATGNITISTIESGKPWTAIFAEIDAIPVSEQDWEEFEYALYNVRTVPLARERVLFDDEDGN